jgi:hypothetical protein
MPQNVALFKNDQKWLGNNDLPLLSLNLWHTWTPPFQVAQIVCHGFWLTQWDENALTLHSMFLVLCCSFDILYFRYYAVTAPITYSQHKDKHGRVYAFIVFCWLASIAIGEFSMWQHSLNEISMWQHILNKFSMFDVALISIGEFSMWQQS